MLSWTNLVVITSGWPNSQFSSSASVDIQIIFHSLWLAMAREQIYQWKNRSEVNHFQTQAINLLDVSPILLSLYNWPKWRWPWKIYIEESRDDQPGSPSSPVDNVQENYPLLFTCLILLLRNKYFLVAILQQWLTYVNKHSQMASDLLNSSEG